MSTTEIEVCEASATARIRSRLAVSAVRVATLWQSVVNRRQVNRLLSWDHRMLADIGLTPGDVRSALSVSISEDPSQQLRLRSRERRSAARAAARERAGSGL